MTPRLILLAALLAAGCGRSPEVKYYVLPTLDAAPAAGLADDVTVIVGPVEIPRLLDRPEIMWRTGNKRIRRDDVSLWGASLGSEIQRALSENLLRLLGTPRVVDYPAQDPEGTAWRISFDVQQLEAAGEQVTLRARWIVRRGESPTPRAIGTSRVTAPLAEASAGSVVEAYGAAVEKLSREVAERLTALARTPPPGK